MEPKYIEVNYGGYRYGIALAPGKIGVCRNGHGRIKYMPVVFSWKCNNVFFPVLYKTRLSSMIEADELFENLAFCARAQSSMNECVTICEHILQYGRGIR